MVVDGQKNKEHEVVRGYDRRCHRLAFFRHALAPVKAAVAPRSLASTLTKEQRLQQHPG